MASRIPTYTTDDFNARQVTPYVARLGKSTAGQLGSKLVGLGAEQAREEGAAEGARRQQEAGVDERVNEEVSGIMGLVGKERRDAMNASADMMWVVQKQETLNSQIDELMLEHQNNPNPEELTEQINTLRQSFISPDIPTDRLSTFVQFFDQKSTALQFDVSSARQNRDIQEMSAAFGTTVVERTRDIVNSIGSIGFSQEADDKIEQLDVLLNNAVENGLITPQVSEAYRANIRFEQIGAQAFFAFDAVPDKTGYIDNWYSDNPFKEHLDYDQINSIGIRLTQRNNRRRTLMASERSAASRELQAATELLSQGRTEGIDEESILDRLRDSGATETEMYTATNNIRNMRIISEEVNAMNEMQFTDQTSFVRDLRTLAMSDTGTLEERAFAFKRLEVLSAQFNRNAEMIEDNPWGYHQLMNPGLYEQDQDGNSVINTTSEQGLLSSRDRIATALGINVNQVPIMPPQMITSLKQQYDNMDDAIDRVSFISDIVQSYGSEAERIFNAMDNDTALVGAGRAASLGFTNSAEQQILASEAYEENKSILPEKGDVDDAFDSSFSPTSFPPGTQRIEFRTNYDQLVAMYMNTMPETEAYAKASSVLMEPYDMVEIKDRDMIIPKGSDVDAINNMIENIVNNPSNFNIHSNNLTNDDILDVLSGSVSPVYHDGRIMLWDNNNRPIHVRSSTNSNNLEPLYINMDGSIDSATNESTSVPFSTWNQDAIVPEVPDRQRMVMRDDIVLDEIVTQRPMEETVPAPANQIAEEAFNILNANGEEPDYYIENLTDNNIDKIRLAGVSSSIRGGELPDWAVEILIRTDEFIDLRDDTVLNNLRVLWANEGQRDLHSGGQVRSPLDTLERMVRQLTVEDVSYDTPYRRYK